MNPDTSRTDEQPTEERPVSRRGRLSRSMPIMVGAVIAAAGLTFGSIAVANAQPYHPAPSPSVDQQAAQEKAQDAVTPVNGNTELNVNVLEDQIEHYYGSATATYPVVGTVTIPASNSNYARQMKQIVDSTEAYLANAKARFHGPGKPAVIFDVDDTTLNTYDYTLSAQFGYDPATTETWVDNAAFPAVPYMPQLVKFAADHGYSIFYITGRPQTQSAATIKNLTQDGYAAPLDGHLFLKPSTTPSYLHCANPTKCTTTEYKSGTRRYISSQGYTIVADLGDQYSDLEGGDAGYQVKIPNPMYYLP